jgi:lipopolysaccharide heptosyltransferase II
MNILQLIPRLDVGGAETTTIDLSLELTKRGHKVIVVSAGGRLVKTLEEAGVSHYLLPVDKKSPWSIWRTVPRLVKIVRKENIEIVHARSRAPGWIAYFACRKTGVAFVTTCHGYYRQHFFSRVMGWARRVIVASESIKQHMIKDFNVDEKIIRIIPRGVDLAKFPLRTVNTAERAKGEYKIGIIGRLSPIKGHYYFFQAIAKLRRSFPYLRAQVVGEPRKGKRDYLEKLKMFTRQLGIDRFVDFLGTRADVASILSGLDVLVLATTTQEAFGRVIIEAMAVGVPVVATRVGGVVDIIQDGVNGLLVEPKDSQAIARAISTIIKNDSLQQKLVIEGRKSVENKFNLAQMFDNNIKVYTEACTQQRILVVKFSAIGDVVLITPSLRAIREKFPGAYIAVLTKKTAAEILKNCPYIDEVIVHRSNGLKGFFATVRNLQCKNFDLLIDFQNNRKSRLYGWFSRIALRYGYANGKFSFLLNHRQKNRKDLGPVEHQFGILSLLGISFKDARLELWPSAQEKIWAKEFLRSAGLKENEKLVGMNLGASPRWQTKRWPLEYFAKLVDALADTGVKTIIFGSKEEDVLVNKLLPLAKARPIVASGKTDLNQLTALLAQCSVFLTSDSAPLHIAQAMHIPTVVFFGPTDPGRHVACSEQTVILSSDVACQPCYKTKCASLECLKKISVNDVLVSIKRLLSS